MQEMTNTITKSRWITAEQGSRATRCIIYGEDVYRGRVTNRRFIKEHRKWNRERKVVHEYWRRLGMNMKKKNDTIERGKINLTLVSGQAIGSLVWHLAKMQHTEAIIGCLDSITWSQRPLTLLEWRWRGIWINFVLIRKQPISDMAWGIIVE